MKKEIFLEKIKRILNQFGGPIKINYQTIHLTNITQELIDFHINNIDNITNYSISDLYSLYGVINYAINDLGEDEFSITTGLDLYSEGYVLLNYIKKLIFDFRNLKRKY